MICMTWTIFKLLGTMWWRENVLNQTRGKSSNFNNKPPTGNTNPVTIRTKWQKHSDIWDSIPIYLDKWSFSSLTFLASSLHHPVSLYKEGSICDEEMLKYSSRTEVHPGSHRLDDLWHFVSMSNRRLLFTVHISNNGIRSLNTEYLHSYCSNKMFVCGLKLPWPSNNWPVSESLCESSYWDVLPLRICCTVRETDLQDHDNMS